MQSATNNAENNSNSVRVDLDRLSDYLSEHPRVVAATVFGSACDGRVRTGSDLDVAVLFDKKPDPDEFLTFYSELCDCAPEIEVVDLVTLNDADTILAFEALRGQLLCKNDPDRWAGYFSLICREYEDVMGNLEHQKYLRQLPA